MYDSLSKSHLITCLVCTYIHLEQLESCVLEGTFLYTLLSYILVYIQQPVNLQATNSTWNSVHPQSHLIAVLRTGSLLEALSEAQRGMLPVVYTR